MTETRVDIFFDDYGNVSPAKVRKYMTDSLRVQIEQQTQFEPHATVGRRIRIISQGYKQIPACPQCGNARLPNTSKGDAYRECGTCSIDKKKIAQQNVASRKAKIEHVLNSIEDVNIENATLKTLIRDNFSLITRGSSSLVWAAHNNEMWARKLLYLSKTNSEPPVKIAYDILHSPGKCSVCGTATRFINSTAGYAKYCKQHRNTGAAREKAASTLEAVAVQLKQHNIKILSAHGINEAPAKIQFESCGHEYEVWLKNGRWASYTHCIECCPRSQSAAERQVIDFCNSIAQSQGESQYHLGQYKLDYMNRESGICVEYDGLMFHSFGDSRHSMFASVDDETVGKLKILKKMRACSDIGMRLVTIRENEWACRPQLFKSILQSAINPSRMQHIGARKCVLAEVTAQQCRHFFEVNHAQGFCAASIYIALMYEGEIVSCMSFGKARNKSSAQYEMIRVCTKMGVIINGGAERLFKHFIDTCNPDTIISFCDRRLFSGRLYTRLGFEFSGVSSQNYSYFKESQPYNLLSRYQCQKHKLPMLLGSKFDARLTESQNMFASGHRRIWDAGNLIYRWASSR